MKNFIYVAMISFVVFATGGCGNKENNQTETAKQQTSTATNQKQADQKANPKACYYQKMADFRTVSDKDAIITRDMSMEWEQECGYSEDLENSESESASFDDDGKNNSVVASTTTTTAAPVRTRSGVKIDLIHKPMTFGGHTSYTPYIVVTSTENEVNLESINVNRGNCEVAPAIKTFHKPVNGSMEERFKWPYKMNFGQTREFIVRQCDAIIEVQIKHDGTTYKWDISN